MKKSYSIKYYAMGFSLTMFLLFFFFGLLTYNEIKNLHNDIQTKNKLAAEQELISAIDTTNLDITKLARDFSDWEEVSQQIRNPLYYAYWHNNRALQTSIFPNHILDVSIYNAGGQVLSKLDTSTMPMKIDMNNLSSKVDVNNNKMELLVFIVVYDKNSEKSILGYIGLRANLIPELTTLRQYNFLDPQSIKTNINQHELLDISDLINHISFQIRSNPVMNEIINITISMLIKMALIIGIPTLMLYPMVTYLIANPLQGISQHIDRLKNNNNIEPQNIGTILAVSELEKVSHSLNEYHIQLFDVHTSLDHKNKELWTLAHHDSLTGALNRRAFDEHWRNLNDLFSNGRIEVSLAIFDVNNFKAFNDSYGHNIGDEVLKGIAHSITQVLRKGENFYRIGGDEFACIFVDSSKEETLNISERCNKAVSLFPFSENGITEPVRISIGLSHAQKAINKDISDLQWQADIAMYSAKQPGKSHITFYTDDMKEAAKGLISSHINNIVYEAITYGTGIHMYYQPIVTLKNQQPDYYEALVRIDHDDKQIMPNDIFQLVEARRLEAEMDMVILKQIYLDLDKGLIPKNTGVSINISGPSIVNQDIIDQLEHFTRFINDYKLVLEITETTLITQLDEAADNLMLLRNLGFLVALDDFGSGYSSIRYLATMPVDIVKFDISLIRSLADDSQKTIVKHLARMIAETDHKLVAEGIETEDLLLKVKELDFAYGQGYLFGKPVSNPAIRT